MRLSGISPVFFSISSMPPMAASSVDLRNLTLAAMRGWKWTALTSSGLNLDREGLELRLWDTDSLYLPVMF